MKASCEPKLSYRGRFAPSPSGPLHFGSLVCALASYLDAKTHNGIWLVRMEDIDPPREQQGAAANILATLQAHHLAWDEAVLYQSSRAETYRQHIKELLSRGLAYRCNCTRKRLAELGGRYDGHCLRSPPPAQAAAAIRLHLDACLQEVSSENGFIDLLQGEQANDLISGGDFIIHRKDGLFAYQLAVVVDDIEQGITQIVRGADLLETTAQQRLLFRLFGKVPPGYAHIPVLVDTSGNKLSKQNHAKAVNNATAFANLRSALELLGLPFPHGTAADIDDLLIWAIENWNLNCVPRCSSIRAPSHTM